MNIKAVCFGRLFAPLIILCAIACSQSGNTPATNSATATASANRPAENRTGPVRYSYEVVNKYPHDTEAFLQGLVYHDSGFYESTGGNGQSSLRRVELESGRVLKKVMLAEEDFGEGLALVEDKLVQLTWQSGKGYVYDRDTFRKLREFSYSMEGWGLAFDGKRLILSDGSNTLTFLDPRTYQVIGKLNVTLGGRPLTKINELEFIEGEIWANVWHEEVLLRIDPATGAVNSMVDLRGLRPRETVQDTEAVLNGIAYDPVARRIFVSGKRWPSIFEIRIK
ncbi:MAG TPA: glutaminyl-peptide cyclotransferase [Blastocatellia bacterium]|jgi:glutamine cyclotransferase